MPDGRHVLFPRSGSGWDRAVGDNLWLDDDGVAQTPGGGRRLRVRDNAGGWWSFAPGGGLVAYGRGEGSAVEVHRDRSGEVVALVHERGRRVDLDYQEGRVVVARSSDGRRVEYGYDESGLLVSVSAPAGTRRYGWGQDGLLETVRAVTGELEVANTYDAHGRVVGQVTAHGRRIRLAYLPGRLTVVSDPDGSRSNSWVADARGRVVGVVDSDGRRQSMAYDRWGNLVTVRDREGARTVHLYDGRGRRTRTAGPAGSGLTYEWDEKDRLVRVTTTSGATASYEYEGAGALPSVVVDPEGGRSLLQWREGLLIRVVDPEGVTVSLEYDAWGDVVAVTNAEGGVARMVRDAAGRVTEAVSPSGARTLLGYDQAGRLVRREDPDGALWRWEYGAGDQVTAVVDPAGARTEMVYGPGGQVVSTRDPLGRVVSRSFDDLGNVSALELAGGARWSFVHDALSRVREVHDPEGGSWLWEYGQDGELTGVLDPTGVRQRMSHRYLDSLPDLLPDSLPTQARPGGVGAVGGLEAEPGPEAVGPRLSGGGQGLGGAAPGGLSVDVQSAAGVRTAFFDELGRPVAQQGPDGACELAVYDRCGRVVESVDAAGGLTRLVRDRAGRVVEVVAPGGGVTGYAYDACGRVREVRDPGGGVTTLVWDADSRLAERHLPTGEVERVVRDRAGRVVRHVVPGAGVWRGVYDRCGRVVACSDPAHGLRRFRYDVAGQLVEAVNALGGATRFEYDDAGRNTRVTDPVGGVTQRRFNARNQVVAQTDPLGRTTEGGYDAAGRQVWQRDPEGRVTAWAYDESGRQRQVSVDGQVQATIVRDYAARTVKVTDRTGPQGEPVECVTSLDPRGYVVGVRREGGREGVGTSYEYDSDGRRLAMVDARGRRTTYRRDLAGRLTAVDGPAGQASFRYDDGGRLVEARAGAVVQEWVWRGGYLAEHAVRGQGQARGEWARTRVSHDEHGRVSAVHGPAGRTELEYDAAGQLVAALTSQEGNGAGGGGSVRRWAYDAAGRITSWVEGSRRWTLGYDAAGQVRSQRSSQGTEIEHSYDGAGRRTASTWRQATQTVRSRSYRWSALGYLTGVDDATQQGTTRRSLWVDASGEVAGLCVSAPGQETVRRDVWWDQADGVPYVSVLGDTSLQAAPGGLAGSQAQGWASGSWRAARATGVADPWAPPPVLSAVAGPAAQDAGQDGAQGVGHDRAQGAGTLVGATGALQGGGLLVGGVEVLGARAYDPLTASFLSTDPLAAPVGASWAANPYSYAGNDPVGAVDPWGLTPVSDADLACYTHSSGIFDSVGQWWSDNWEYVAAGAMAVAGVALMFTGVGGAAGVALMAASGAMVSGGISVASQKYSTGSVDASRVGVDMAIGLVAGGAGGATGLGMAARYGSGALRTAVVSGMADGGVSGTLTYAASPGPHTTGGYLGAGLQGAGIGGLSAGAMHQATTAAHVIDAAELPTASRPLAQIEPAPVRPQPPNPTVPDHPTFIAHSNGTVIPTSRTRLEQGLIDAGLPSSPTDSPGMQYFFEDGTSVRIMEPSGPAGLRASFERGDHNYVSPFTGKPVQAPTNLLGRQRREYVMQRTHIDLYP